MAPAEVEALLEGLRRKAPDALVQVFSSARPPNPSEVSMLAAQTLAAQRSNSGLAERPELDLLLRLATTRQIGEAFKRVGYKVDGRRLFLVVASDAGRGTFADLEKELAKDERFTELVPKRLTSQDLDRIERAALLAARA